MAATKAKQKSLSGLKPQGDSSKVKSGKKLTRPTVLEDKNSKVNLVTQSRQLLSAKKGKGNIASLPPGVQDSVKNKERITSILNHGGGQNSVDDIRKKYNIQSKPITLKTARIITEERNIFFAENRSKAGKSAAKAPLPEKKVKSSTKK